MTDKMRQICRLCGDLQKFATRKTISEMGSGDDLRAGNGAAALRIPSITHIRRAQMIRDFDSLTDEDIAMHEQAGDEDA